jgi:hypothetical protein
MTVPWSDRETSSVALVPEVGYMKRALIGILVVIGLLSVVARAQETERLFKAAMNAELVDGDLKTAIEQYKKSG